MHRCRQTQNYPLTQFSIQHHNPQQRSHTTVWTASESTNKRIRIILQIIVKHFKYKIILSRSNNNTMDNLATWLTYKMYQSYILGISFKPEFYKSGLSLPGMFANIWIGQRDFELTSPNSLFQISISWYHRQVHRKTLYTGLRRQTKAQGTHPFSKAGLTGAQVARLFIGAPDKRGQEF